MRIPEIVAPGGSYTKAMVAAVNGADAVYLGVPFTSLRMRQNKLNEFDEVKKTIEDLHKLGVRAYLTMNIVPRNQDIKIFESVVEKIKDLGADAIIFSDLGTYRIIRKHMPDVDLHLSTQANTLNIEAVKFWADLGVKRVVLARELSLQEIKEIKEAVPEMDLEVFSHGAMCMSYSGRCLLGDYFNGRESNKGECSHVCRFEFNVYLEEPRRPGQLVQVGQDENGSHLLSSKDLCTLDRLEEYMPYVDGLKIEGRSKGEMYAGAVVKAYRHVRDSIVSGEDVDENISNLVNVIAHREYWDGFMFHDKKTEYPEKELPVENIGIHRPKAGPIVTHQYYGLVFPDTITKDGKTYYKFETKNTIYPNETLSFISRSEIGELTVLDILDENGNQLEKTTCNFPVRYLSFDRDMKGWDVLYRKIEK